MDFILGIILGIILLAIFRIIYQSWQIHHILIKPLDMFINMDISSLTFIERKNALVKIEHNKDYYLIIQLNSKSVNIFIKGELVIYSTEENKKKIEYLFNKLTDGFYHEIYTNVIKLNDNIFSNNLFTNIQDSDWSLTSDSFIPSIDDILDKINKSGVESLTKTELNILKKNS